MVQLDDDAPCCDKIANSPPVAMLLSLPLGGGLGLVLSLYAYQFWFIEGLTDFTDALEDLGVKNASLLTNVLGKGVILIMLANCFVCLYGFREKCRIRNNIFGHISCCGIPCIIKFFVKTGVQLFVCAALAICLVFMAVLEAMWVVFLTIDAVCQSDALDAVTDILDLVGGDSTDITETCDTVASAKDGTWKTFLGCLILSVSQIIIIAYWYKYSTLAMVAPFYTTGKWAKAADADTAAI